MLKIAHARVKLLREQHGRKAHPSAGAIDDQSVKTTESGDLQCVDADKKIKDRKRHIVNDTKGHLVGLQVPPADTQDRNVAVGLLASICRLYP